MAELVTRKADEDKTWLIAENGKRYSYRETDVLSDGLASGFHRLGIKTDDKVAIFAYNSPEWILSYFALLKLGAVPVTVNTGFIKDPLVYNLQASDSICLILDSRLLPAYKDVEQSLNNIEQVVLIGKENLDSMAPTKPYAFVEDFLDSTADECTHVFEGN